jgi:hypothetical protein
VDTAAIERNAQRGRSKQASETFASQLLSNVENLLSFIATRGVVWGTGWGWTLPVAKSELWNSVV